MARAQNDDARTDESISQANDLTDRVDAVRLRRAAGELEFAFQPHKLKPGEFYLYGVIDSAATSDSNPLLAVGGSARSLEFDNKGQLNYGRQFEGALLTASATVDVDRYSSLSAANQDNILGNLKLEFNGVRSPHGLDTIGEAVKPPPTITAYLQYTPTIRQTGDFERHRGSSHDLGGGLSFKPGFFAGLAKAPWSYSMDLSVSRRLSSTGDSASVYAKSRLAFDPNPNLTISFAPGLRYRAFDARAGVVRKDETLTLPLTFAFDPQILKDHKTQVLVNIAAARNWSNLHGKQYGQWNFGPTFEVVHLFH